MGLASMVCSEAAGEAATAALVQYLREQRVMKVANPPPFAHLANSQTY